MLELCPLLLAENPGLVGENEDLLVNAVQNLVDFYAIMANAPRRLSPPDLHRLRTSMLQHLFFWKLWGGHMVPKHHFAYHLVERADRCGNPRFSWTYADEQENRVMGQVAKSLHAGRTFYTAFLQRVLGVKH